MVTALVSMLTQRPVDPMTGMTGEVTLQGQVLPIGGLKLKALAAHRAGLKRVIVPKLNEVDLDEIPEAVCNDLEFILVDDISEVLHHALIGDAVVPDQSTASQPVEEVAVPEPAAG